MSALFAVLGAACSLVALYDSFVKGVPSPSWLALGATQMILAKLYERK